MSSDEILQIIDNMDNDERWKLLLKLFYLYFNRYQLPEAEIDMN